MERLNNLVDLLNRSKTDEAIEIGETLIRETQVPNDEVYYLLGNAYRKKGDWQNAINNYLQAISCNPDSPAQQAYDMAMEILSFYNKDMYNQ